MTLKRAALLMLDVIAGLLTLILIAAPFLFLLMDGSQAFIQMQ